MKEATKQYLKDDVAKFEEMTEKFVRKEISMKDYKGFSGGYGSYAQRGGEAFMLRLRMNQGILSKEKLKFILDTLSTYQIDKAHLTTCQTCQLHNVPHHALGKIMRDGLDHDIVTRGGGGDFPRNVMCDPLSGVDPNEHFNIHPYAHAVGEHVLEKIHTFHLPRKLKIAFSNSDANKAHATFRDLGFCANADQSFDVYCAGGLGNNPKMGVCVGQHVAKEDILFYVEAMILLFQKHGNYENRAKARTRYMQESLGIDALQQAFQDALAQVSTQPLKLANIKETSIDKQGDETIEHPMLIAQKQKGLYALHAHPIGGDVNFETFTSIYDLIKDMQDVELRISPQQDLYIINLTATEAQKLLPLFDDFAKTRFERSVACIGASICQVGLRDSQHVLHTIINTLKPYNFKDGILPLLHISGCPSSCGTHQIADIGLQGSVKLVDKKPESAFILSVYGNDSRNNAQFGQACGTILETDITKFLIELATIIQTKDMTFESYTKQYPEAIMKLIQAYTA